MVWGMTRSPIDFLIYSNYGYLSINGERGSQTVDEGDEVTITFVDNLPPFGTLSGDFSLDEGDDFEPVFTPTPITWTLSLDGVELESEEVTDGDLPSFLPYVIDAAAEDDAGSYRLELTVGAKVVRVGATLGVTPSPVAALLLETGDNLLLETGDLLLLDVA